MTSSAPVGDCTAHDTEERPQNVPSTTVLRIATSYVCDRETRELGEDYFELTRVERAYRLLERRLSRAAPTLHARRSIESVTEFSLLLADARHDASFGSTLALAKDAFSEARVIKIARAG